MVSRKEFFNGERLSRNFQLSAAPLFPLLLKIIWTILIEKSLSTSLSLVLYLLLWL